MTRPLDEDLTLEEQALIAALSKVIGGAIGGSMSASEIPKERGYMLIKRTVGMVLASCAFAGADTGKELEVFEDIVARARRDMAWKLGGSHG